MARLIIHSEGKSRIVELGPLPVSFGRGSENTVMLKDTESSRRHFQIEQVPTGYKLADLESRNGTKVNGRVVNATMLKHGDQIEIGATTITYDDADAHAAPPPYVPLAPAADPGPRKVTARSKQGFRRPGGGSSSAVTGAVFAVVAAIATIALISVFSKGSPTEQQGKELFDRGMDLEAKDPRQARDILEKITQDMGTWYDRAQARLPAIRDVIRNLPQQAPQTETDEFEALKTFVQQNLSKHEEILVRSDAFKAKYPRTFYGTEVDEIIASHRGSRTREKELEIDSVSTKADAYMAQRDYHLALGEVNKVMDRYKTDIDVKSRIIAKHTAVVEAGKLYAKEQGARGDRLAAGGDKQGARDTYFKLLESLGDGQLEEFADQCKAAKLMLESFK